MEPGGRSRYRGQRWPCALPPGTRVRVEDLFGKVPARRKFLRSARSEWAASLDVVRRLALARPDLGFTLEHDGRRALHVQPGDTLAARTAQIVARELHDNAVAVDLARGPYALMGVAGLPTYNRGVADHQYLFVNGRPVKDKLLIGAVRGAYADYARARSARGAGAVSRCSARRRGRQCSPGENRSALPRSCLCARDDRLGPQQALMTGDRRSAQTPDASAMRAWQAEPIAPAAAPQTSLFWQNQPPRVSEAGQLWRGYEAAVLAPAARAEAAAEPVPPPATRLAWRAGKSRRRISWPRPKMVWCWSISTPRMNGWCLSACVWPGQGRARPRHRRCLLPEVVELDEPACDRLEEAADQLAAYGLVLERFGPAAMLVRSVPRC